MQKCSKYQSQSKILKQKEIFLIILAGIIIIPSQIFAEEETNDNNSERSISDYQQFSLEERKQRLNEIINVPLEEQKIRFEITNERDVKVMHIIGSGEWDANNPRMIEIFAGNHLNVDVTDWDNDTYPFFWEDETFEKSKYVILQQKLRGYDLLVKYEIENFFELNDGLLSKNIILPEEIEFIFDKEIKMIYVNSRPIDITNTNGINCIGCNMKLEFFKDDKYDTAEIITVSGEEEIKILSDGDLSNIVFNEALKEIFFQTEKVNQLITIEIPHSVILFPFEVYLTEKDDNVLDQNDKILKTETNHNDDNVKLTFRPNFVGNINIIGSTQDTHEAAFSKIKQESIKVTIEEEEEEEEIMEIKNTQEVLENWKNSEESSSQDYSVVLIIIGVITAIIIGVIIKIKKN